MKKVVILAIVMLIIIAFLIAVAKPGNLRERAFQGMILIVAGALCYLFVYLLTRHLCYSGFLPLNEQETMDIPIYCFSTGYYLFRFTVMRVTKNQFTLLCEIFAKKEDEKEANKVTEMEIQGDTTIQRDPISVDINGRMFLIETGWSVKEQMLEFAVAKKEAITALARTN